MTVRYERFPFQLAAMFASVTIGLSGPVLAQTPIGESAEMSVDEMENVLKAILYPLSDTRDIGLEAPSTALTLRSIHFASGSADIGSGSQATLENLAKAMQRGDVAFARFEIQGHTDAVGSARSNLILSQRRAESVREFLIARGVQSDRLTALGKGEAALIELTEAASAVNRRVEIRLPAPK